MFILNFSEYKYSPTDVLEYLWKAASIFCVICVTIPRYLHLALVLHDT